MSSFQINDVVLSIAPEQIHVTNKAFNHQFQTLRTTSSIKSKSGFSIQNIVISVKFTNSSDEESINGFVKLQALVAQFRVTPFCYVENEYLRNTIMGGNYDRSMALALESITINKSNDNVNVFDVIMSFSWFNYLPYIKDFKYKQDMFLPLMASDPRSSKAWKRLYKAELKRHHYSSVSSLGLGSGTGQSLLFATNQYATMKAYQWQELQSIQEGMEKVRNVTKELYDNSNFPEAMGNFSTAKDKILSVLKDAATSMFGTEVDKLTTNIVKKVLKSNTIGSVLTQRYGIDFYDDLETWSPVQNNDGELIRIKSDFTDVTTNQADDTTQKTADTVLLSRRIGLNFESKDLIISGVSVNFNNILATIPLAGHAFPTFQHIGSTSATITISFITTNPEGLKALSNFNSLMESQNRKFRNIPQGQRNVEVINEIVQMFGLKDFLIEDLTFDTVPKQPGTTSGSITLIDNPITPYTREKIQVGQSFTTNFDIRRLISNILLDNISFSQKSVNTNITPTQVSQKGFVYSGWFGTEYKATGPIYNFKSKEGALENRNLRFKDLCIEYARNLTEVFSKLLPIVLTDPQTLEINPVIELFALRDVDILGIERLQQDLYPFLQKSVGKITSKKEDYKTLTSNLESARSKALQDMNQESSAAEKHLKYMESNMQEYEEDIAETLRERYLKKINKISNFINGYLYAWNTFTSQFIDKILYSGNIEISQFAKVREAISLSNVSDSGSCYPDFPLAEVMQDLQLENPEIYQQFLEYSKVLKLKLQNIGDEALIGPDYYFWNPIEASADKIIGSDFLNKAIEVVKYNHGEARREVEKTFIEGAYEQNILGPNKKLAIDQEMINKRDKSFWEAEERKEAVESFNNQLKSTNYFVPDDFQAGDPLHSVTVESQQKGNKSLTINPIKDSEWGQFSNQHESATLLPAKHAYELIHQFGIEAIDYFSPNKLYTNNVDSVVPYFQWPVDLPLEGGTKITLKFGVKDKLHQGEKYPFGHTGLDIASSAKPSRSKERTVLASARGRIFKVSDGKDGQAGGARVNILHSGGCITRYFHMQWETDNGTIEPTLEKLFRRYSAREQIFVEAGTPLGKIGNTGHGSGPHLHFEVNINGKREDPEEVLKGTFNKIQGPLTCFNTPSSESLLTKSVEQFEKDLKNGQGYSMARAYPTFKLYFIESDSGERKRFCFDDFFSYSAVKDIIVIRNKKIAADLCIIQLTNISGVLNNRKFRDTKDGDQIALNNGIATKERSESPQKANTQYENPITSLMLQPGIQVQLRLGFSNDPNQLERLFNGVIVDVNFSEGDNLVEITCQSFAIELVQTSHGDNKKFGGFLTSSGYTGKILSELLTYPEVVHFGRWEGGPAENSAYGILKTRFHIFPTPKDDNIFAPFGRGWRGLLDSSMPYTMNQTTIWDVFQEMTLRHPGTIAMAVPYEGKRSSRMTMFFGCPEQLYFARDPTDEEDNTAEQLKKLVDEAEKATSTNRSNLDKSLDPNSSKESFTSKLLSVVGFSDIASADQKSINIRDFWLKNLIDNYTKDKGVIKPFRNYHLFTSTMHIISNDITSSSSETFNTSTIKYKNSTNVISAARNQLAYLSTFGIWDPRYDTFTLKCDAALPDEQVREVFGMYDNCRGFEHAKRYALATLTNSLKEGYRGSLTVIGNPRVRPNDIAFIFDEYTDTYGPIEVEQVVHRFSQETGFITEITPQMVVHINNLSSLTTTDAMALVTERAIRTIKMDSLPAISKIANTGKAIIDYSTAPIANMFWNQEENMLGGSQSSLFGMTGIFFFKKLITRSQCAHPIRYSPLVKNGKPMLGGVPILQTQGSFTQGIKKWLSDTGKDITIYSEHLYNKFHPNNWFGHWQGSLSAKLKGRER